MTRRGDSARALGLSILALGVLWLLAAAGVSRGLDALGLWQPTEVLELDCGRRLIPTADGVPVTSSLQAVVAIDDAWLALGTEEARVRSLVVQAAGILRGAGVSILPVEVTRWNPPPDAKSPRDILEVVEAALPVGDADVVILLTAASTSTNDGAANVGGRHAVIRHHPDTPGRDAMVLAHELGHLLGAHHGCDVAVAGGVMGASGFTNSELLCPCTRRVIEHNVAALHQPAVAAP